jgi:hypothetical protein
MFCSRDLFVAYIRKKFLEILFNPLLGVHVPFNWYQSSVWLIRNVLTSPLIKPTLFKERGWIPIGHHTLTSLIFPIIELEWLVT